MLINKWKKSRKLINVIRHLYSTKPSYDTSKDYFKVLGVQKTATDAQIKSAYYKLALKYHPDHNKGMEGKFKEINEAYTVLSDSATKRQYENSRNYSAQSGAQNPYGYGQANRQYYQDPFENLRNQYNQRQSYNSSYNQQYHSQWHNNQWENQWQSTQWQNSQRQQRKAYQNPYDAYQRFRQQYEHQRREQMRRGNRQQYQQYEYYTSPADQKFDEKQLKELKKTVRRAFLIGIAMALLLGLFSPRPEKYYINESGQPYPYRVNPYSQQADQYYGDGPLVGQYYQGRRG